ncbi:hypothetical protein [Streptomyces sp. NPDC018045]
MGRDQASRNGSVTRAEAEELSQFSTVEPDGTGDEDEEDDDVGI